MDQLTAYSFFLQGVNAGYPKAGKNIAELILKARFPWSSKHAALGYCIWAVRTAPDAEKASFQEDCEVLVTEINPDAAMRERTRGTLCRPALSRLPFGRVDLLKNMADRHQSDTARTIRQPPNQQC